MIHLKLNVPVLFILCVIKGERIWLGGLFTPEAYITATKQYVAKAKSWSLEQLTMKMSVAESEQVTTSDTSFVIIGLKIFFLLTLT